jgi:PAS domain S-box-containing protein
VFWKDDQFIHTRCFTRDITERKQAEQKLRENEERFRSLSACSPVGIFLTDVEGRCTYTNPRCQAICGFTLEESLGEGWSQSVHPEDRQRVFADWSQTTREGREYSDEFRCQTKDTRVRWVYVRSSPMFSDTGELIGHVGTVEDISDRKQAEVRIAESENRLRTIIETEPECVKLVATDGTLLQMNAAGLAMIEASSADAVIGQSVYSLIPPEHREAFVALNESVCQGNRGTLEFEMIGLRGTRRWMETHAVPLRNESDGTLVHLAITRDITVRKQAEEELRQLNTALENAVEGISRLDIQGRYIAVNKAYASTLGYQPEEMIGMVWQVTVHPDDLQKLVDAYQQMLKAGKVEVEARGVRKDGSIFYKQVVMVAAYDSGQQFIGHHCFAKDISDRKQAEKALKLAKQELEIRVEERTAELRVANEQLSSEIAERKRAEVELEKSLSLLRGTLEATAEGIIVSQQAAYIATCNQKFIEMWGIPESVIASREIKQLLPLIVAQLKDPQRFMSATQELFAQPDAEAYGIIELNDGRIFERYSLPQRIGENIVGRVCCFRDITERKRAEVELQRSEQKYRNLFHNSLVGIFRNTLTDGTVLDANAAVLKMFGIDSYQGVKSVDLYVNPQDREILKQQLFEKGFIENFEAQVRRKDGSVFWVSYSGKLYLQEGYLEGVMIDITERKIAEEALHKAKQELEIRVEERTAQLRQAIGQLQSEVEERKIAQEELQQSEARFREVAYREALLNRFANLIRNSLDLDTILETAVRELYNRLEIDVCLFSWCYSDGTPCGWKVVKEAKNPAVPSLLGLQPLENWYSFSCKLVNQEVCQVDNVTESDCAMQQMLLPYGTAAMLSLPIHTQSGEVGAITCGRLVSSRSWTDEEMELLQAVANQLAIAINQAQLYEQSRIAANIAQTKATELEVALRQLQQAQAQLVQSEKMSSLGQLVAGVAHEINNPLSFIHGNLTHVNQYAGDLLELVQLYEECYPNSAAEIQALIEEIDLDFIKEDLPKVLSSMQMGTERIHTIVLSLRNFSRADRTERKWADIHEGLDNTLLILAHRLKAKSDCPGIEVIKEYGDLPKVQCYLGQLNQVFMNILSNAIDAIAERCCVSEATLKESAHIASRFTIDALEDGNGSWVMGHGEESSNYQLPITNYQLPIIRIRTEVNDSNQVIIRIADNGLGMTQEVQQRLFDPFFTTKPVGHGTGLGMSISYQIVVERHGGQLQCISAPGQGTEFFIYLPIEQQR